MPSFFTQSKCLYSIENNVTLVFNLVQKYARQTLPSEDVVDFLNSLDRIISGHSPQSEEQEIDGELLFEEVMLAVYHFRNNIKEKYGVF